MDAAVSVVALTSAVVVVAATCCAALAVVAACVALSASLAFGVLAGVGGTTMSGATCVGVGTVFLWSVLLGTTCVLAASALVVAAWGAGAVSFGSAVVVQVASALLLFAATGCDFCACTGGVGA